LIASVFVLVACTFSLTLFSVGGLVTLIGSALLGSIFVHMALNPMRHSDANGWAKRLFFFSLVHLVLMFLVLTIDQLLLA